MTRYFTRHQSLKHIWYQRYNIRSSSRFDGVVPWYEKKGFKKEAWATGTQAAWWQLMKEREILYNNENKAKATILEIETSKSGSLKLWVNIDNPYAEKWDFGDVNIVTIRKNEMQVFKENYGMPRINTQISVTLSVYHRSENTGFSYKIKYEKTDFVKKQNYDNEGRKKNMALRININFDEDENYKINKAKEERDLGTALVKTAIITEDKLSFKKGLKHLENAANILQDVLILKQKKIKLEQRLYLEHSLELLNCIIYAAKSDYIRFVELPQSKKEMKNSLYKLFGEIKLKMAESYKKIAKMTLEYSPPITELHASSLCSLYHNLTNAHMGFYKANPNDEDAKLIIKYLEKAIKLGGIANEGDFENDKRFLEDIKNSNEALKKFVDNFFNN
jgi:hypothetical protein